MDQTLTPTSQPQLLLCTFTGSPDLTASVMRVLGEDSRYGILSAKRVEHFLQIIEQHRHEIDCLILEQTINLSDLLVHLHRRATLLPAVIVQADTTGPGEHPPQQRADCSYHTAEVWLPRSQINDIPQALRQAIKQFLQLSLACRLPDLNFTGPGWDPDKWLASLNAQQQRLSEKLKERLGYLGVYYKRNPQQFFRNMPDAERHQFLQSLTSDYHKILLDYFQKDNSVNQQIDTFVNRVFFADISVSQVLEIHMGLMDVFAKKLKLEGRNEDILLDYRLVLIDTIAHLCEMYRRSIPRND